ncbi:MAG: hypothetical protein QM650_15245 [Microlunatus sp.]
MMVVASGRSAWTSLVISSACLLFTLAGCSRLPPPDPVEDSFEVLRKADARVVVHAVRPAAGMDSQLEGKLAIGDDGCLGILGAGGSYQVVIFPFETRWSDQRDTLEVNGRTVRVGDDMRLQGGMTSNGEALALVHKECAGAGPEVFDSTGAP